MNDQEQVRAALRGATPAPPSGVRVDPAAARRAGDARARTRVAVTTSLAFSLVILAGLSAVFIAAHRSRPVIFGSLGTTEPSTAPPTTPTAAASVAHFGIQFSGPVVAGRPATLEVLGSGFGALNGVQISWGDGGHDGVNLDVGCLDDGTAETPTAVASPTLLQQRFTHTYAAAGPPYGVIVTVLPVCGPPVTQSINEVVLPAPVVTVAPTTVAAVAGHTPAAEPSASATGSASATPSSSPSAAVSVHATPTASAIPASATPSVSVTPVRSP